MARLACMLVTVAAVLTAGCDDDSTTTSEGLGPSTPSLATFQDFVVDLIDNRTTDRGEPVDIDFSLHDTLDPNAFDALFP